MKSVAYWILSIAVVVASGAYRNATYAGIFVDLPELEVMTDNVNPANGFLDVVLTLTAPELGSMPPISSFNLDIFVSAGNAGLTLGAPIVAPASPLFASHELVTSIVVGPQQVRFGENIATAPAPNSAPAFNGAGLVRIPFTIAAGNFGQTWTLSLNPGLTDISDDIGNSYTVTLQNGSISAVPEAGAWQLLLVATGAVAIALAVRRRSTPQVRLS
jgi:hypothetical protein